MSLVHSVINRSFLVPPDIVDDESSSDTLAKEGMRILLNCHARGNPAPTISWVRVDGKPIRICSRSVKCQFILRVRQCSWMTIFNFIPRRGDVSAGGTTTSRRRTPENPSQPVEERGSTVERSAEKVTLTKYIPIKKGIHGP